MDKLDKILLMKLLGDCRASYRQLARELGVTCPTIKRRVDRLVEMGIIERFTIDISQETLGVGWVYAEIETDLSEDRDALIQEICSHKYTNELFAVGSKKYLALAEVPILEGMYSYGKFLRSLTGVRQVDLFPIKQLPTRHLSNLCKYSSRGVKVSFSDSHLRVLKQLINNARISINEIAKRIGFRPKRVRKVLKELHESEGVHFTIRFNPAVEDCINFVLKLSFDEDQVSPGELAYWIEEQFSSEHWMSFMLSSEPVIINYMTSDSLSRIEMILRKMKYAPFIFDVETMLIYCLERSSEDASLTSFEIISNPIFVC